MMKSVMERKLKVTFAVINAKGNTQ